MKLVLPSFEILSPTNHSEGVRLLQHIESMARISHRSEDAQTPTSWERFLRTVVLQHGDWSVVEHASATVLFQVNRGITHELVRHRLFGFTQESTRFVNYAKPTHAAEFVLSAQVQDIHRDEWTEDLKAAETIYLKWLYRGYSPQIARDHLPNALGAKIAVTGNLRNWRHFLLMRTSKETHPDFKVVTLPLLEQFKMRIPLLFDDIIPEQKQSISQAVAR